MPVIDIPADNTFSQMQATGRVVTGANFADIGQSEIDVDVAVIGSGAGGAACAAELAEAGLNVAIFEAGGFHVPFQDFTQREEQMLPKIFYESGARTTEDASVIVAHGKGVGGSTVHNICLCVDPPRAIIERWQREFGFPHSLDDLAPLVARARAAIGVNPLVEEQINPNNMAVKRGADALGWKGFIPDNNRLGCLQCGYCFLGCAYNRKQSALITYIPRAVFAGARLFADARVDTIEHDGAEVSGLRATVLRDGKPVGTIRCRARRVVVAASGVLTPALLLQSGMPDPHGRIGTTLRLHPAAPVAAVFDEVIDGWHGVPQTYMVNQFATFERTGYGGFTIFPVFGHPATTAPLMPGVGFNYTALMKQYRNLSAAAPMVHDETMGRIDVNRAGRVRMDYWPNEADRKELIEGIKRTAEMYFAAGARLVVLPYLHKTVIARGPSEIGLADVYGIERNRAAVQSVHPQGSVRMAADPRDGWVDVWGESHHIRRLYVADTSLFPTSLGTAPQITTMTLGMYVAGNILSAERGG